MKANITKPNEIWEHLKDKRINPTDDDRMDLLMKTIKAVHSSAGSDVLNVEELGKKRAATEQFSRLITPKLFVSIHSFEVDNIPCEKITPLFPHRTDRVILYCHGGGYVSGGLGYARILGTKLSHHTGLEVFTFEYRLAPEHKYPAAFEDCIKIWDYLMLKGYGADDIIVAGDSAGGNMSLELCAYLKGEERKLPRALILFSPWTDMRACQTSYETHKDKDPLLTYDYIVAVRDAYIGKESDPGLGQYSPLFNNMDDFPPTYVQVGSNEILKDDSELLEKELKSRNVYTKLDVIQGGWHVFQQMPIPKATQAMEMVNSFIQEIG